MHRLQQFLSSVLYPQIQTYQKAKEKNSAKTIMFAASIMESFLWLHLGTEIGAFPQPASRDIYRIYLSPFFSSLSSLATEDSPLYVTHSHESGSLLYMFGRFADVLLEKAMRHEEVFSSELAGFSRPDRLVHNFQTFLILHSRLVTRPPVESFTYYVTFADHSTWHQAWNTDCDPGKVELANVGGGTGASSIVAGYLNLWGHAAKVMAIEKDLAQDAALSSDFLRLKDRLAEMRRWRINLRSGATSKRFADIRNRIFDNLTMHALEAEGNASGIYAERIFASIDEVFSFWHSDAPETKPAPVPNLEPA